MTNYLITGGCGFLGSNIAAEILNKGDELSIFDNLSRHGSSDNLKWLKKQGEFRFINGDIRSAAAISDEVSRFQPDVIFHLAG
jgi:CDP-paratose 2-epimerase